jgi:hypothetical protein
VAATEELLGASQRDCRRPFCDAALWLAPAAAEASVAPEAAARALCAGGDTGGVGAFTAGYSFGVHWFIYEL